MCWTSTKDAAVLMVAARDITVYKVMVRNDDGLCSIIQGYEYEAGKEYVLGKELQAEDNWLGDLTINEGFHSYGDECCVHVGYSCMVCSPVRDAKHESYYYLQRYSDVNIIVLVECVIPEGSAYFRNIGGEFVSDRIRITDKVVIYEDLVNEIPMKIVRFQDIFSGDRGQKDGN